MHNFFERIFRLSSCDSLLISAAITSLVAFSFQFRHRLMENWKSDEGILNDINLDKNLIVQYSLGNMTQIHKRIIKGLPNDTHSIENEYIIWTNFNLVLFLIDPQFSEVKFLRAILGDNLVLLRFD
jgi:hypothetical protein